VGPPARVSLALPQSHQEFQGTAGLLAQQALVFPRSPN